MRAVPLCTIHHLESTRVDAPLGSGKHANTLTAWQGKELSTHLPLSRSDRFRDGRRRPGAGQQLHEAVHHGLVHQMGRCIRRLESFNRRSRCQRSTIRSCDERVRWQLGAVLGGSQLRRQLALWGGRGQWGLHEPHRPPLPLQGPTTCRCCHDGAPHRTQRGYKGGSGCRLLRR